MGRITRLLTAGCSFTKHCWPTWADYLGKQFTWSKNLAVGGSDNASIARSIMKTAKKGDTVIIMWTGYDRLSFYNSVWEHTGCLIGNKEFYCNFYSPVERFTTTMDYVQMIDNHSKINEYTCYHFSAFPWFTSEKHSRIPNGLIDIYNNYSIDNNNFLLSTSLLEFQEQRDEVFEISHKYCKKDTHPTPITQWNYLKEVISEKVQIDVDDAIESMVLEDQDKVLASDID